MKQVWCSKLFALCLCRMLWFSLHLCSSIADWFQERIFFLLSDCLGIIFQERYWNNQTRHTNLSICARNLVSKMPLVLSRSDSFPLNSRPLVVKSISTFLTISPRYMPLIIFSYLQVEKKISTHTWNWQLTVRPRCDDIYLGSARYPVIIRSGRNISFLFYSSERTEKENAASGLSYYFIFVRDFECPWCPDEKEVRCPTNAWTIWCAETSHNITYNNKHWQQGSIYCTKTTLSLATPSFLLLEMFWMHDFLFYL